MVMRRSGESLERAMAVEPPTLPVPPSIRTLELAFITRGNHVVFFTLEINCLEESALPSQQLHKCNKKQTTWSKPHETRQIRMILMDEEGNKIECTMEKPYVILGKALEEYADVYIHKPTLDVISNVFQCYPLEPATQKLDKRITLKLEDLEYVSFKTCVLLV
uniref:Uncharacterized protein n=1 Tax=Lactuca sativa TaxID=4236 RepID=A0A9R1V9Z6_LACSA|nr:hypothetical protein LSAT_V11C600308340 [Lactuca sativa]